MPQTSNVTLNQPTPKKKHPIRIGCLSIIGVVVLIGVIVGIVSAAGGGGKTKTPAAGGGNVAAAGTVVKDGKFEFQVTSVSQAKTIGTTAAQGEYTILHVKVSNIGTEGQTLDDSNQYVYDAAGKKYTADSAADLGLTNDTVFLDNINPGNSVSGEIAFDMAKGDKAVKAELHDSAFSDGVAVKLP